MERSITGFHQDEVGDWVAELSCGHNQHVRHRPPFQLRPWVLQPDTRAGRIGTRLPCPLCDRGERPDDHGAPRGKADRGGEPVQGGAADQGGASDQGGAADQGGEPVCLLASLCPECDAVLDASARHRPGCPHEVT